MVLPYVKQRFWSTYGIHYIPKSYEALKNQAIDVPGFTQASLLKKIERDAKQLEQGKLDLIEQGYNKLNVVNLFVLSSHSKVADRLFRHPTLLKVWEEQFKQSEYTSLDANTDSHDNFDYLMGAYLHKEFYSEYVGHRLEASPGALLLCQEIESRGIKVDEDFKVYPGQLF